jgi:hypothetical protein
LRQLLIAGRKPAIHGNRGENAMTKHVKALTKARKPALALDVDDLPVDIQFIIDVLNAVLLKKSSTQGQ